MGCWIAIRTEEHRCAWRRISAGVVGAYRPRLGRAERGAWRPAEPAQLYLKKIYLDTIVFTPWQLAALVDLFGAEKTAGYRLSVPHGRVRSDWTHHSVASLSADDRAAIAGGNARTLFGI